jgi:hypothetical protein
MQLGSHNNKKGELGKKKDSKRLKDDGEKINENGGWAKREVWYRSY